MFKTTSRRPTPAAPAGTDADVLQAAHRLVDVYLVYLREHAAGNNLVDTRELPALKDALISAFRVVIATESRPAVRTCLVKAGMTLAQFQENVGPRRSIRPMAKTANSHAHPMLDHGELRRTDQVLMRIGEDKVRLGSVFASAVTLAETRQFPPEA